MPSRVFQRVSATLRLRLKPALECSGRYPSTRQSMVVRFLLVGQCVLWFTLFLSFSFNGKYNFGSSHRKAHKTGINPNWYRAVAMEFFLVQDLLVVVTAGVFLTHCQNVLILRMSQGDVSSCRSIALFGPLCLLVFGRDARRHLRAVRTPSVPGSREEPLPANDPELSWV
jgi:hypothetical protein